LALGVPGLALQLQQGVYRQEIGKDFTMSVQYYVEQMLDYGPYKRNLPSGPARDRDRHLTTLRLTKLLMNQNLRCSLFTYYSPTDKDVCMRPNGNYKVSDELAIEVGGNIFFGDDPNTFFGQFQNDTNVYAGLRYSFYLSLICFGRTVCTIGTIGAIGAILLGHDHYINGGGNVAAEFKRHSVRPHLFNMFGQVHNAIGDLEALLAQISCYLAGGNRAEQMPLLVGFGSDHSLCSVDRLGRPFQPPAFQFALLGTAGLFLGYRSNAGLGGRLGQTLRQQIISRISFADFDNVSKPAKFLNIFTKQNLHVSSLLSCEPSHGPTIKQ
jgi:hypothetical protein